ncbi:MAG: Xaa-Pro dipeptidase [Planctomycetota bacterium]
MPETTMTNLYAEHLTRLADFGRRALEHSRAQGAEFAGIVFHAGSVEYYHADDHPVHFHSVPHFARYVPIAGPDHLLVWTPGASRLRLIEVVPTDYWFEPFAKLEHPYREHMDIVTVESAQAAIAAIGAVPRHAYIGNDPKVGAALGLAPAAIQPPELVGALDWYRAYKTDYEVDCLRAAARIGANGYRAAAQGFHARASERELFIAFQDATQQYVPDLAFNPIIGWDEMSSVLHYQSKRATRPRPAHTLLVDAGARAFGYASDTTRTWCHDGCDPVFRAILARLDALQLELCARCRPGQDYVELHDEATRGIARILVDAGVLKISATDAFERRLVWPFFPHGLGHHLGLQVHDVGGKLHAPGTQIVPPPERAPHLRTTRPLEVGHVVTIEPGIYFIPMLLAPHRTGRDAAAFHWPLIDRLIPCGGMRIEDDVLVTSGAPVNLTRPAMG